MSPDVKPQPLSLVSVSYEGGPNTEESSCDIKGQ